VLGQGRDNQPGGGRIVGTSEINEEGDDCCDRASGNANLMMLHIV